MVSGPQLERSRLHCRFDKSNADMFFSLVDYRNNYFTSNHPEKVVEFYNGFESRDQLIQWMRDRPKGTHTIYEVEGDNDIIVVIPTADYDSKYAKECRDDIFKGLHIIFVESGRDNFYVNLAYNLNAGIAKALDYNPKWIIYSNDDVFKIDSIQVLVNELNKLDGEKYHSVFLKSDIYHSTPARISVSRFLRKLIFLFASKRSYRRQRLNLEKKFWIRFFPNTILDIYGKYFFKGKGMKYINIGDFFILSGSLVRSFSSNLFDETFVNGCEDHDLSIRIQSSGSRHTFISYRIGSLIGRTLGQSESRSIRDIANLAYFNEKLRSGKIGEEFS